MILTSLKRVYIELKHSREHYIWYLIHFTNLLINKHENLQREISVSVNLVPSLFVFYLIFKFINKYIKLDIQYIIDLYENIHLTSYEVNILFLLFYELTCLFSFENKLTILIFIALYTKHYKTGLLFCLFIIIISLITVEEYSSNLFLFLLTNVLTISKHRNDDIFIKEDVMKLLNMNSTNRCLYSYTNSNNECMICYNNIEENEIKMSCCKCCLHEKCLFTWIKQNKIQCMICKKDISFI